MDSETKSKLENILWLLGIKRPVGSPAIRELIIKLSSYVIEAEELARAHNYLKRKHGLLKREKKHLERIISSQKLKIKYLSIPKESVKIPSQPGKILKTDLITCKIKERPIPFNELPCLQDVNFNCGYLECGKEILKQIGFKPS